MRKWRRLTAAKVETPFAESGRLTEVGISMTFKSGIHRRTLGHAVAAVILAGTWFGVSVPATAQEPLQDVLEQLLQQQGVGGGGGGGGGALDAARDGNAQSPFSNQAQLPGARVSHAIKDEELIIVRRFCEGRLEDRQRDFLALVPEFSPLEQDYCRRAGSALLQFGYEVFDGFVSPEVLVNGAIPDDYRLGIGDEIVLTFRGQLSNTDQVIVDREGRVFLDDLPPIRAAGRTFGEFRQDLEARIEAAFVGTEVFVSLGAVRAVAVAVTGEVRTPGVHQLTGLSTVYDALAMAGGIAKTGSLRRVLVYRGGSSFELDIYDLLTGGPVPREIMLVEGDRIVVPSLGPTVAVAGKVIRPAIYELRDGQVRVTVDEVLALAGGALRPSGLRILQNTFDEAGRVAIVEVGDRAGQVRPGDLIDVEIGADVEVGTVVLAGHVTAPGRRSRASAPSIGALIGGADGIRADAYLPFAVLETTDAATSSSRLFAVNLQRILAGQEDYALKDGDRFSVFSMDDIRFLTSSAVQESISFALAKPDELAEQQARQLQQEIERLTAELGAAKEQIELFARGGFAQQDLAQAEAPAAQLQCLGLESVAELVRVNGTDRFAAVVQAIARESDAKAGAILAPGQRICPAVFRDSHAMLPFVMEHAAVLGGEVRQPGAYPVVAGTPLAAVASIAGGVTRDADLTRVEVTRHTTDPVAGVSSSVRGFADMSTSNVAVLVGPGDTVRFNQVFTDRERGPVVLAGEVLRPGRYEIRRGETLSQLLARAGGLTAQAYPYGAVFTRESIKAAEREGFIRAARELESAAIAAATRQDVGADAVAAMRQITAQIAAVEPVGRMVIEADPTVLQVRPDLDVVLQPGDRMFIPKRPSSVLVIGDVLSPGAQQFLPGTRADRYIQQAGGFQQSADKDRVYLVYPNGVAEPQSVSVWNYSVTQIPPGSTIVAPTDPAPFDLLRLTSEVASVVSQIAVTLASLAVITD